MKNLYRFLAVLMFAFFVTTTGAVLLNKEIEKTVKKADAVLTEVTTKYSEDLEDAKIKHNLYLVNCFPSVCAKGSFVRYEKNIVEIVADLDKDGKPVAEKEVAKVDKYDAGSTEFLVAKINPITKTVSLERGANNFILLKNNEKIGSAYFKDIAFKKDLNLYSKEESLEGKLSLNVDLPKLAYKDLRVKATSLQATKNVYDETDTTVSSKVNLNLKEFAINNDENLLDVIYDIDFVNIDKQIVGASEKFVTTRIKDILKGNKVNKESIDSFLNFSAVFVETIRGFDENKSAIKINNLHINEHNLKTKKSNVDVLVNADVALDADLNPVGFVTIKVKPNGEERIKDAEEFAIVHPTTGAKINLLTKAENGQYVSNIKFVEGKAIINEQEIDINGQIRSFLDFATRMLNLMTIQNMAVAK